MLDSAMLDVAIGVVSLYLLLSLLCSAVKEYIAGLLNLRANTLHDGVCALLHDPDAAALAAKVRDHPLVSGITRRGKMATRGKDWPSYIPSRVFAAALLDVVAPADPTKPPKTFDEVRAAVARLPSPDLQRSLINLLDQADRDLAKARERVATWFDDSMERVSGWYRRRVNHILLALGFAVSVVLNADTIAIGNDLFHDNALRAAVAAGAEQLVRQPRDTTAAPARLAQTAAGQLESLGLPLGWRSFPATLAGWFTKAVGLLITTFALSMGAPFWFGVLNRFVNVRSGGPPPKRADQP